MAKKTSAPKRTAKAIATPESAVVGASHFLRGFEPPDPLATAENCWGAAVSLFSEIEKRHGVDQAKRIFKALGAPSKPQRKVLQDAMLWSTYELLLIHDPGLTLEKAAELIYDRFRKDGRPEFGVSADAIRKHILRIQSERRRQS
jgi:hypothetical protein